jgi:hypothetical protein
MIKMIVIKSPIMWAPPYMPVVWALPCDSKWDCRFAGPIGLGASTGVALQCRPHGV